MRRSGRGGVTFIKKKKALRYQGLPTENLLCVSIHRDFEAMKSFTFCLTPCMRRRRTQSYSAHAYSSDSCKISSHCFIQTGTFGVGGSNRRSKLPTPDCF